MWKAKFGWRAMLKEHGEIFWWTHLLLEGKIIHPSLSFRNMATSAMNHLDQVLVALHGIECNQCLTTNEQSALKKNRQLSKPQISAVTCEEFHRVSRMVLHPSHKGEMVLKIPVIHVFQNKKNAKQLWLVVVVKQGKLLQSFPVYCSYSSLVVPVTWNWIAERVP